MTELKHEWDIAGISRTGTRHIHVGKECEDSCGWFTSGEVVMIAMADGAGSAPQSALGSAIAVRAAISAVVEEHVLGSPITKRHARKLVIAAFESALRGLQNEAAMIDASLADLACTLAVIIALPDFVVVGHVGDGATVMSDGGTNLITLSGPTKGQFANETALLGCSDAVDVQISSITGIKARHVAVFTDGMERLALQLPSAMAHPAFFIPLFSLLNGKTEQESEEILSKLLGSTRVTARSDDDLSLVVARLL